jgi:hypothetical protein
MLKSLKTILTAHAPDLLARTHLPRKHPEYLTQTKAFDIYRKRRLDDLAKQAPDLFARLELPYGHSDHLDTIRAYALLRHQRNKHNGARLSEDLR